MARGLLSGGIVGSDRLMGSEYKKSASPSASYFLCRTKESNQRKTPPRHGNPANRHVAGIFRLAIHGEVAKTPGIHARRPLGLGKTLWPNFVGSRSQHETKAMAEVPAVLTPTHGVNRRPVGRRTWMCAVFRPGPGCPVEKSPRQRIHRFASPRKSLFFGSFLLGQQKNELALSVKRY
jgi:hypothetical protein